MHKSAALSIGLTMILCVVARASGVEWTPEAKDIAKLETVMNLSHAEHFEGPAPGPLAEYARFYAGVVVREHRMIRGALLLATPTGISVVQEKQMPAISDGGCGIIYLLYDAEAGRVVWIRCNGIA